MEPNEVRLDTLRQGDTFTLVLSTGRRIPGRVRYVGPAGVAVEVRPENEYREAVVTDREGHKRAVRIRAPSRIEHWAASTPVIPDKGEEMKIKTSLHGRLLEAAQNLRYDIETVPPDEKDPRIRYRIRGGNSVHVLTPGEAADFFGIPS